MKDKENKRTITRKGANGKIIAHAAGKHLYCVNCHNDHKDRLRRIPEKIELADAPRTVDDVGVFICPCCEKIFGRHLENVLPRLTFVDEKTLITWLQTRERNKVGPEAGGSDPRPTVEQEPSITAPSKEDKKDKIFVYDMMITDASDELDQIRERIAFIQTAFINRDWEEFSEDDRSGFHFILDDIQDDIQKVSTDLYPNVRSNKEEKPDKNPTPSKSDKDLAEALKKNNEDLKAIFRKHELSKD